MISGSLRVAVAFAMLALGQAHACGFRAGDLKGEGEPCTRSDECESALECRGGVCMAGAGDAGPDAATLDAATDGGDPLDAAASDPLDAAGI